MKFTIFSPTNQSEAIEIDSEARTWGELKIDIANAGISTTNMIGVLQATRVNLELDEALLPNDSNNHVIFLFQNTMKSGGPRQGESVEAYNARRRKEYAAAKKKDAKKPTKKVIKKVTPVKKATKKVAPKPAAKEKVSNTSVDAIIDEFRSVKDMVSAIGSETCEKINVAEERIDSIIVSLGNLEMPTSNREKLMAEYAELKKLLEPYHRLK